MDLPLDEASLLSLFLETLLYGVFLNLYLLMLLILLNKTGTQRQLLITVATLLLCFATAHLLIDFVRALEAFIFEVHTIGADGYYLILASPLQLAKTTVYVTQTILADGVIVWRCYILNRRRLSIAIPGCIVLLANGALGCSVIWILSQTPLASPISATGAWCITAFYILTMLLSVTCTGLIAWRIYHTRRVMPGGFGSLLPVFIVIVESGALYSTSVLASLIAFLAGSNGKYPAVDVIPSVMGISFCLIILQVHFEVGSNHSKSADPRSMIINHFPERDEQDASYSMEPMNVHITNLEDTRTEDIQSDMIDRDKRKMLPEGVFQL
ncbi:hypothetical protein DFH29DRAFT_934702 [Suillus ampliporus]|nr:hypothetical protein DFH29DRAFT_934702 [Suillus ampliporus]